MNMQPLTLAKEIQYGQKFTLPGDPHTWQRTPDPADTRTTDITAINEKHELLRISGEEEVHPQ